MAKRKKAKKIPKEKRPMTTWTRKELQDYIRKETKKSNKLIAKHERALRKQKKELDTTTELLIDRMQIAGSKRTYEDRQLRTGSISRKSKAELLLQARELQEFRRFMENPTQSTARRDEKFKKAYRRFNRDYGGGELSEDEYADIIDIFGVSGDYFNTFGYEDFIGLVTDAVQSGTIYPSEFVSTISKLANEIKRGKIDVVTTQDAIDELVKRLGMDE